MCDLPVELILAPLPAKRKLWEAADEFAWKTEVQRDPGAHAAFGLAADGDMVKMSEDWLSCNSWRLSYESLNSGTPSRSTANWEEWCSEMDRFGGLVMLAASLIS
ncbi:hypothetical protein VMCG_10378 [Cytospora schulzeri]|uniref:Uncharacterized protein n=1 Tax=Cytospora schulzeri TaxID=448051 RepID=A0A423VC61_9PEZI|nr:hypothetical protein VMCG_10378 [Valsa malicola]